MRVAVEEVAKANRDVFFFPSHELVAACGETFGRRIYGTSTGRPFGV